MFLGPARRRATGIKHATLAYLSKKLDRQYEIRSRELALKEKAQALEEKRFEFDWTLKKIGTIWKWRFLKTSRN